MATPLADRRLRTRGESALAMRAHKAQARRAARVPPIVEEKAVEEEEEEEEIDQKTVATGSPAKKKKITSPNKQALVAWQRQIVVREDDFARLTDRVIEENAAWDRRKRRLGDVGFGVAIGVAIVALLIGRRRPRLVLECALGHGPGPSPATCGLAYSSIRSFASACGRRRLRVSRRLRWSFIDRGIADALPPTSPRRPPRDCGGGDDVLVDEIILTSSADIFLSTNVTSFSFLFTDGGALDFDADRLALTGISFDALPVPPTFCACELKFL